MTIGVIGRKAGMTRIFTEAGETIPVTVIEVPPNRVSQVKSVETDGYRAVQVAFGNRRPSRVTKPMAGHYAKAGIEAAECLREFRLDGDEGADFAVGQEISVAIFEAGQMVDVRGVTKGRGFAGVFKRYNMRGGSRTHGTHEAFRHGGSIGQCMTPGRVFKGLKMPGHHGSKRKTVQNLKIVDVLGEKNVILVRGPVPGHARSIVTVRKAVKKSASRS